MNVQTERLENHSARITVSIDEERFQKAMQRAAKELSKQYRIPGFRKGKAPYRVVAQYVGEASILKVAVDKLTPEVFAEARYESGLDQYGTAVLENVSEEVPPVFTFALQLAPEVDLGNYREIRQDYEPPQVEDDEVDEQLKEIRRQYALVEDSHDPIEWGNRVKAEIRAEFADEAPKGAHGDEHDHKPQPGDAFIEQQEATLDLEEGQEIVMPGFAEELIGADVSDELDFTLTVPEDHKTLTPVAGRVISFNVSIIKVETVTLPALDDDFAARVIADDISQGGAGISSEAEPETDTAATAANEPPDLSQLRMYIRESLQKQQKSKYDQQYADEILNQIIKNATVAYPDDMLNESLDELLQEQDDYLRGEHGTTLADQLKLNNQSAEQLREAMLPQAHRHLQRSLVLSQFAEQEGLLVTEAEIEAKVDEVLSQFGGVSEPMRSFINQPQYRDQVASNMVTISVTERLCQIGRGDTIEDPHDATSADASTDADDAAATSDATPTENSVKTADAEASSSVMATDATTDANKTTDNG